MGFLKPLHEIIFGYEMNAFSDHKNLVYLATPSESQRVMCCRIIFKDFGHNIQYIAEFDNILCDMISIFLSTWVNNYKPITSKIQYYTTALFSTGRVENKKYCFPLNLLNAKIEQQKDTRNVSSKISTDMMVCRFSYSNQYLKSVKILCYDSKIYVQ